MSGKAIVLGIALALGTQFTWGYLVGASENSSSPVSPQDEAAAKERIRQQEEQSLLRHCRNMADVARGHTGEFLRSLSHGRANLDAMQPHLREVRSAVDSMLEDHRRLLNGLTEEQWTAAIHPITSLEKLRASLRTQLEGIDLELQMPAPDAKVLIRYGKKLRALLEDWRKQHRKMAAAIKVNL